MKNSLLIAAAIVLGSVGVSFARDRHHHHSSRSHHSSHRSHYRGHGHGHGHSIFSFGLSIGRSYRNYGGYGYSPSYYGYSSPACVIQSAPDIEVEIPPTPTLRRKVYPVPPRVEPLESNPNIGPASQRSDYGQTAVARQSQLQQPRGTSEIPVFDLQNFEPESRSLTSNDGIPFVVSSPASQSIANNKTQTQLPLLPPLPVKKKTVAHR